MNVVCSKQIFRQKHLSTQLLLEYDASGYCKVSLLESLSAVGDPPLLRTKPALTVHQNSPDQLQKNKF